MYRLRVQDLDVSINSVQILHRIQLEIKPGEMLGLIGRNGAGKTTILRTILGLLPTKNGQIYFDDEQITAMAPNKRVLLGIGYLPENRGLIGALTVRQNLAVPIWARKLRDFDVRLDKVCAMVPEIEDFLNRPALSLSGGQQKLVGLARALICGDKLVLLDEPFEGVSPVLSQRLIEAVGLARADGMTIILAESDSKGRKSDFDRKIFIERGQSVNNIIIKETV